MVNFGYVTFSTESHNDGITKIAVSMEIIRKAVLKKQLQACIEFLQQDVNNKTEMGITGDITQHESNRQIYLSVPNNLSNKNNLSALLRFYFLQKYDEISKETMEESKRRISPRTVSKKKKDTNPKTLASKKPKRKAELQTLSAKSKRLKKESKLTESTEFSFSKNLETFWKAQQISPLQTSSHKDKDIQQPSTLSLPDYPFQF